MSIGQITGGANFWQCDLERFVQFHYHDLAIRALVELHKGGN